MSKNDNQNSDNELNDDENESISTFSSNSKSETLNLFSNTSIRVNKNVKILKSNENITSVIEDVLQKCDEHILSKDINEAGCSTDNKQIAVLHFKQFDSISSSDCNFSDTALSHEHLVKNSNTRPVFRMSDSAFQCFILQNFPSAIDLRRKSSSTWHNIFQHKNAIHKPTSDISTQFDLPSIEENDVSTSVFSRQEIATVSQQIQISPSVIPPRPIHGSPPLHGAPPSYSAVMRIGYPETAASRPFGRRLGSHIEPSPPFISPSPPPSYAETQGRYYRPIIVDSELIWGPDPMAAVCQRCGAHIITTTTSQRSNLTHFAAVALCLCGCWPCCLLPYCMNSCKNTYHYCPNCNTYLGMYRPW